MRHLSILCDPHRLDPWIAWQRALLAAGLLQGSASGVEYEQRRFKRAVPQGADPAAALPKTAAWLRNVFRMVRAAATSGDACSRAGRFEGQPVLSSGMCKPHIAERCQL